VFAFPFPILESPSQEAYALDERYRAYQEVILKLDSLHNAFPEITRLDSIRHPTQDRPAIWCLKISDNPFLEEEPAILLLGNQYPEELLGGEVLMGMLHVPTTAAVKLEILDLSGRRAASFLEPVEKMGCHSIIRDISGVSSGIYFHKLTTEAHFLTRKMVLLR
jgi:hypothetical protein